MARYLPISQKKWPGGDPSQATEERHAGDTTGVFPVMAARRMRASTMITSQEGSNSHRPKLNFGDLGLAWWLLWRLSPPVSQGPMQVDGCSNHRNFTDRDCGSEDKKGLAAWRTSFLKRLPRAINYTMI